ncbi:hypothetical protein cyc_00353 [Cyclospora cayetanensis]|uniref:Uncharacterized protein n=1 Tax=Cyclospora cayetanensis TaxID=88456 RepID=A0A1D3D8G8_9EIME|nr:hypothetical protein cyc_00353 [Cyclospora cayetanensis]
MSAKATEAEGPPIGLWGGPLAACLFDGSLKESGASNDALFPVEPQAVSLPPQEGPPASGWLHACSSAPLAGTSELEGSQAMAMEEGPLSSRLLLLRLRRERAIPLRNFRLLARRPSAIQRRHLLQQKHRQSIAARDWRELEDPVLLPPPCHLLPQHRRLCVIFLDLHAACVGSRCSSSEATHRVSRGTEAAASTGGAARLAFAERLGGSMVGSCSSETSLPAAEAVVWDICDTGTALEGLAASWLEDCNIPFSVHLPTLRHAQPEELPSARLSSGPSTPDCRSSGSRSVASTPAFPRVPQLHTLEVLQLLVTDLRQQLSAAQQREADFTLLLQLLQRTEKQRGAPSGQKEHHHLQRVTGVPEGLSCSSISSNSISSSAVSTLGVARNAAGAAAETANAAANPLAGKLKTREGRELQEQHERVQQRQDLRQQLHCVLEVAASDSSSGWRMQDRLQWCLDASDAESEGGKFLTLSVDGELPSCLEEAAVGDAVSDGPEHCSIPLQPQQPWGPTLTWVADTQQWSRRLPPVKRKRR